MSFNSEGTGSSNIILEGFISYAAQWKKIPDTIDQSDSRRHNGAGQVRRRRDANARRGASKYIALIVAFVACQTCVASTID